MNDEQLKLEIENILYGLPGLDTSDALDKLGGNPSMYISFIDKFYHEYKSSIEKLNYLLSENELQEAHRLVHSIKSISGNLGAAELYSSALSLEADMERGKAYPSEEEVKRFASELQMVLDEVNAFLRLRDGMEI